MQKSRLEDEQVVGIIRTAGWEPVTAFFPPHIRLPAGRIDSPLGTRPGTRGPAAAGWPAIGTRREDSRASPRLPWPLDAPARLVPVHGRSAFAPRHTLPCGVKPHP
jgi:hypothetical protein